MTESDWLYQPLSSDASLRGPVLGVRADLARAIGADLDMMAVLNLLTLGCYDPEFAEVTNPMLMWSIAHAHSIKPASAYAAACRLEAEHYVLEFGNRPGPGRPGFSASVDPALARVYQWDELPASTRADWATAMLASPVGPPAF